MAFRVQIRRDPSGKWTVNNPILLSGEFGYETDTTQIKIGDGVTPWIYLPYWGSGTPPITIVNGNSLLSTGLTGTGTGATNANYSIFLGNFAGAGAVNASASTFFGQYAGAQAINALNSNFFGDEAGFNATHAEKSNFFGLQAGYGATGVEDEEFSSNFLGYQTGYLATDARYSNFIGHQAGYRATNANQSNFIGQFAGSEATNAQRSNFLGEDVGYQATNASFSNFLGSSAGNQATDANHSNFIGHQAGYQANNANHSNFIGREAGFNANNAYGSNFIGSSAGYQATNAINSIFFGTDAGSEATNAYQSNFFGQNAGRNATNAFWSNFIGYNSGYGATNANNSNFLGYQAGYSELLSFGASYSNFLGNNAGYESNADHSNFLGNNAGSLATNANNSNFLGQDAGYNATNANYSNFIGFQAGYEVTGVEGEEFRSNFIGYEAGRDATNAADSNFFGFQAGQLAINANNSNFIGQYAGSGATSANYSNFFGAGAGQGATDANHSNLLGLKVGASFTDNNIGSNNIIIGTNISLPDATANSLNIGGILFGTGTYSDIVSDTPSITPTSEGKIGIGVVEPTNTLHIYSEAEDTSGLRLERLTSSSPTSTGQAIGVDASGNVVTVTGSGVTQTLAETLVSGNNTGGKDILLNNADRLLLENNSYLKKGTYDFGASGGISRVCGASYEDMWQNGFRHVFDASGFIRNSTNCFNLVPTVDSDSTRRYKIGSIWTLDDLTNYICTDATEGAAVWELYKEIPIAPYKVYTALLTQGGGDVPGTCLGYGDIGKGFTYTIVANPDANDLTVYGSPDNNVGTSFVANQSAFLPYTSSLELSFNEGAPIVTVLENTIGNIWFTYFADGEYQVNSSDLFIIDKTWGICPANTGQGNTNVFGLIDVTAMNLATSDTSDILVNNLLSKTPIEIRVYN